jgi:hypothetical protein
MGRVSSSIFGDAPTQVYLDKPDAPLFTELAELGKDTFDQLLPLRMHIAERRRDEHADGLPS